MTIELKNEYLTVQFKTLGGQLTSIKDKDGLEYLWQADPEYWNGQAPILFPICGSLRNDWAIYRPQERPFFTGLIRRHGFVRKEEFTLEGRPKTRPSETTPYRDRLSTIITVRE